MLSEASRAFMGLNGEAVFVGHGHKFQIWEPNRFASHLEEAKSRVRQLRGNPAPGGRELRHKERGNDVGRSEGEPAAGGPAHHIPVLLDEVVSALCVMEGGVHWTARSAPAAIHGRFSRAA